MDANSTAGSSGTRYSPLFRIRDWASILFLIGVVFAPYTLLYQAAMLLLCFVHVLLLLFTDTKQVAYAQILWGIGFAIYFFLHQIAGVSILPATSWYRLLICCIMFFVINFYCCYLSVDKNIKKFVRHLSVILVVFDLWCMLLMLGSLGEVRMGGISVYFPVLGVVRYGPNVVGMVNAMCVFLQIYLFDNDGDRRRLPIMLILITSVFLTGSRKSLMIVVGCVGIFLMFRENKNRVKNITLAAIIAASAYLLMTQVPVLYNIIGARMEDILLSVFTGEDVTESSARTRTTMIELGLEYIRQKPWTGFGLDTYRDIPGMYYHTYSHNNYIELAVSGGLPTLAVYYWFYLYMLVKTFLQKTELRLRALSLGMLVMMFMLDYGWVSYLNSLIFLPMSISFAAISAKNTSALKGSHNRHGGNI